MKLLASIGALLACALVGRAAAVDYSRDILPILSDKCYHCHGPDEKGRKAKLRLDTKDGALGPRKGGPVILPGKSAESELVRRISTTNLDDKMPPPDSNRSLTTAQVELLKRWVDEGAKWGMHWAFVTPSRPNADGPTAMDILVANRLRQEGLAPAPEASREMLLRRVSLDLTGLPPTIEETDAFVNDTATNAYEKVVDRLLASPRFGERLASEWLDLARYADTHGYQMDRFRPMWPYRDWVIQAFNANMPYDQFVTWQLAGDLLPNPTKQQRLATAFNRLHNQNEEGGIVEEEYRVAYVVDRVNTFGTAFLGLTTECTRCHDHKYDPLTQRDFYSLFAFFQNIDESGQTTYFTDAMPVPTLLLSTDEQDAQIAALRKKIAEKEAELRRLRTEAKPSFDEWLRNAPNATPTGLVAHFTFDEMVANTFSNAVGTNVARAQDNPTLVPGHAGQALGLSGENGVTFPGVGHFKRADAFTLSLWVKTETNTARAVVVHHSKAPIDAGSRGYELLLEDGHVSFGLHHMWPRNSLKVTSKATIPTNTWVHITAVYDGSSRAAGVTLFIAGTNAPQEIIRDGLFKDISYEAGEPELAIGYRFRDNGFKGGAVDDFRVFNRAVTAVEAAQLAGRAEALNNRSAGLLDYFCSVVDTNSRKAADELHALRREEAKLINSIPEAMVMEELPQAKPAYILKRGAYDAHGEVVSADTPKVLPAFPKDAPRNRLGLAQWLLTPEHPLFARVTVNRAWQMMFGRGIVETSDNFGSQGAQPSNQELLDWLACEFRQPSDGSRPWDMKRLLKRIAMSQTYRQSSKAAPELLGRDPANELLARGPAHRLTAEMLRDQALFTSGLLVEKLGGPSVKPYQPEGIWDIAMGKPRYDQGHGDELHRRSLYTYWKRTVPPPSMVTFDAADRSYCTARRQSTSTPLQALALLNDVQLIEAARGLGQRMLKVGGTSAEDQIVWLFRTTAGRKPTQRELKICRELLAEQRTVFSADTAAAEKLVNMGEAKRDPAIPAVDLAAATVLAQALLNHDATVMKR